MEQIQLMNVGRQHEQYREEYEEAVISVLRSGQYIGGREVAEFEREFAAYEGAAYGVSCGSGTDALVLALRALHIGPGDEVITTAFTFFATAESIAAVGAVPVFVDCDRDTYCMDVSLVEAKITRKTKAVIPVHFYGHAVDMDALRELADRYHLSVISDCAQATGTRYKGSRKGILGDAACFSFFPTKILGADGDGGMVLTDDESVACACRSLKVHGSGQDGYDTFRRLAEQEGAAIAEDIPMGTSKYYNYLIGYNSRLDAVQAALLRRKLTHIEAFVDGRRRHAKLYKEALKDSSYKLPVEAEYCTHAYYTYVLQHENAPAVMAYLKERGVACGTYYPVPMHRQGAFRKLGYGKGDCPNAEWASRTTFAVPVYPELYDSEREYVIQCLLEGENC